MKKLDDLVLSVSPLTNTVYAGYIDKRDPRCFSSKVDVTNWFYRCVINHFKEQEETILDNGTKKYRVIVEEVTE